MRARFSIGFYETRATGRRVRGVDQVSLGWRWQTQIQIQGSLRCAFAESANAPVEMTKFLGVQRLRKTFLGVQKARKTEAALELRVKELEAGFELVGMG